MCDVAYMLLHVHIRCAVQSCPEPQWLTGIWYETMFFVNSALRHSRVGRTGGCSRWGPGWLGSGLEGCDPAMGRLIAM